MNFSHLLRSFRGAMAPSPESRNNRPRVAPQWSVGGIRRAIFYQPLAVALSLLLLPALPGRRGGGGSPFQAQAQVVGCAPDTSNSTTIIRNYCNAAGTIAYVLDLQQFEDEAIKATLALRKLPVTDAPLVYSLGRKDLRSAVRATMFSTLLGIVQKTPANRTPHEQRLVDWYSSWVQANEIKLYQKAITHYNSFVGDPCRFALDGTIATAYKLSYDGTPFCFNTISSLFSSPPVPSPDYFKAYGLRNSYGAPADLYPEFAEVSKDTAVSLGETIGIGAAAGAVVMAGAAAYLINAVVAVVAVTGNAIAAGNAAFVVAASTVQAIGSVTLVAVPLAIIMMAVMIGISAGFQAFNNQANIDALNGMTATLNSLNTTPVDLNALAMDTSGAGHFKLNTTLVALALPDRPSTAALPAHRDGVDPDFRITNTVSPTVTYQDWDGAVWSAKTWGGWLVQTCAGATCKQADALNATMKVVDWYGVNWTATRLGNVFTLTKQNPASTDAPCLADPVTQVTPAAAITASCSSYVTEKFPLVDGTGNHKLVSINPLNAPSFPTPSPLAFGPGIVASKTITVPGNPSPQVCVTQNNLSADFSFAANCAKGGVTLSFNGNASAPTANYTFTITADNGIGAPVFKVYSVTVSPTLAIISPGSVTFDAGLPANFTVVATGQPTPQITVGPNYLPQGLTLTDNGNGTATISGTPTTILGINACFPSPCGIVASSSQGSVEQQLVININTAPPATMVPPLSTTFVAGIPSSVTVTSSGSRTPVKWDFTADTTAPWLKGKDNGDGSFLLYGTPPLGVSGTFTPRLASLAAYSYGIITPYEVNVRNIAFFTNPNVATFTVGTPSGFTVRANQGAISLAPGTILPKGLTFAPTISLTGPTSLLSGTPAAGSGGQYQLELRADAGNGVTGGQTLLVNVNEGPRITSANTATFIAGQPGSFAVTTVGYPSVSTHPIAPNPLPPTNPADGNGMYFTISGLPTGLTATNLNSLGFASGTLTIQGTPPDSATGTYPVTITAQNGVGVVATQTLNLTVVKITGPAPLSGSSCNGNYNGTFVGTLTVGAGQNCSFLGGGVTGNVNAQGGNLLLNGSRVTGNVSVQGGASFSLGNGTSIGGNLTVQSTSSGVASKACGTTVAGNVTLLSNTTAISLGASDGTCVGNTFQSNATVNSNASVKVYGNRVDKTLACSGNTSIAGAGNTAAKKQGQCASF